MLRGLFVTGTGTNVGKTVTSAALIHRYREQVPLRYWKPVQTGIEQDDDTAEVGRLVGCCGDCLTTQPSGASPSGLPPGFRPARSVVDEARRPEGRRQGLSPDPTAGLRLRHPVSPHLAARWSGMEITLASLAAFLPADAADHRWIVEGAGGVLVPLNEQELMIDWIRTLGLPALIVAHSGLGTINHTLLTIEALRARAICVAGVVMCGERNSDNRAAIEHYGRCPVIGEMPLFQPLTASALSAWAASDLDSEGRLLEFLR